LSVFPPISDYDDIVRLCSHLDEVHRSVRQETSFCRNNFNHSVASVTSSDNASAGVNKKGLSLPFRKNTGPLTDKEKAHKISNDLCIICSSPHHVRSNCPANRYKKKTDSRIQENKYVSQAQTLCTLQEDLVEDEDYLLNKCESSSYLFASSSDPISEVVTHELKRISAKTHLGCLDTNISFEAILDTG
jgi:hypothetical protein